MNNNNNTIVAKLLCKLGESKMRKRLTFSQMVYIHKLLCDSAKNIIELLNQNKSSNQKYIQEGFSFAYHVLGTMKISMLKFKGIL